MKDHHFLKLLIFLVLIRMMESRHLLNDWANFGTSSRVKTRHIRDSDSTKSKDTHVPRGKDVHPTSELPKKNDDN
jgi:hypothetical protein